MSEETTPQTQASQGDTLKTLLMGSSIVMWLLAVWMIHTLNNIKGELNQLNGQVQTVITSTAQSNLGNFQLKDADGKVVYTFEGKPMPTMEEGMGEDCPVGESAQSPE